jgi:hypothetical protein
MENFEDFLKEQGDQFRMRPGDRVWEGIETGLDKKRKVRGWMLISGGALVFLAFFTCFILNIVPGIPQNITGESPKNIISTPSVSKASGDDAITKDDNKDRKILNESQVLSQNITRSGADENLTMPVVISDNKLNQHDERKEMLKPIMNKASITQAEESVSINDKIVAESGYAYPVKAENKEAFKFLLSAGFNLSHIASNHSSFLKPGGGYQIEADYLIKLSPVYFIGIGLGFQRSSYRIGAVYIPSYPYPVNNSNQYVLAKLNNEVYQRNILYNLTLPLNVYSEVWANRKSSLLAQTGASLARSFTGDYLIKIPQTDKIFINKGFINQYQVYFNTGVNYIYKSRKGPDLFASYKLSFQLSNTYREKIDLREHYIVHGISAGFAF